MLDNELQTLLKMLKSSDISDYNLAVDIISNITNFEPYQFYFIFIYLYEANKFNKVVQYIKFRDTHPSNKSLSYKQFNGKKYYIKYSLGDFWEQHDYMNEIYDFFKTCPTFEQQKQYILNKIC